MSWPLPSETFAPETFWMVRVASRSGQAAASRHLKADERASIGLAMASSHAAVAKGASLSWDDVEAVDSPLSGFARRWCSYSLESSDSSAAWRPGVKPLWPGVRW